MKTALLTTNNKLMKAHVFLAAGWVFSVLSIMSLNTIPIILSSIASIFAIINYYQQIKKRNKN